MDTNRNQNDIRIQGKKEAIQYQQSSELKRRQPLSILAVCDRMKFLTRRMLGNSSNDQVKNKRLIKFGLPAVTATYNKKETEENKENILTSFAKILTGSQYKSLLTGAKVNEQSKLKPIVTLRYKSWLPEDFQRELEARTVGKTVLEYSPEEEYTNEIIEYLLENQKRLTDKVLIANYLRVPVVERFMRRTASMAETDADVRIIQYACWYLDHYLSVSVNIPEDLYELGWACFWLASKLGGQRKLTRRIVDFAMKNGFLRETIRHERIILQKLNFPSYPVIPMDFVSHLAKWCDIKTSGYIEEVATLVTMCGMLRDKHFYYYYPSLIAAASVVVSLEYIGQTVMLKKLYLCPVYIAAIEKTPRLTDVFKRLKTACKIVLESPLSSGLIHLFSRPPYYSLPRLKEKILQF